MPRGRGFYASPRGAYGLLDLLLLIGIVYFLIKLFIAAAPYALGLIALLVLREFLRGPRFW
ncbi:hypothetical protein [Palaeococcus sp. (in: euryarchaeotes)]|nr:MAG: hypothetical protein DRN39_03475 [Thermococci archaeon]